MKLNEKFKTLHMYIDVCTVLKCSRFYFTISEIQHSEHVKQEMIHINIDDYDWWVLYTVKVVTYAGG